MLCEMGGSMVMLRNGRMDLAVGYRILRGNASR